MIMKIKQNVLMEHLNYVIKGISNKNIIPILNCIKFELNKDGLYLMSTDNDIAIKSFIPNNQIDEVDELGEIVVSGRYIYDIIRKLPNSLINISEKIDNKITINTENSAFTLNCNKVSEFPTLDLEENKKPIILKKKVLKNIVNQTSFATSTQESRPVLTGINFKIDGDILECTATDSYRLAKKTIKLEKSVEESINIIIPTKNLIELIKLFSDDEENVELHIFNNKIIFKFDNIIMMSRLINGTYPDTSKLIPTEYLLTFTTNLADIYDCIDRASLLTNEADKNTIKLETNENEAILSSNIPEIGNVVEKTLINKNNDQNINIAFSSKYMIDALKSFDATDIEFLFNGEIKPIIIKNSDSEDLIQLVLPIKTY